MSDYDVGIVGAGPAGMTAGIYVARAGRKPVVLEAGAAGGQVFLSHLVENYPGFTEPVSGQKLSSDMKGQVLRLGVEILPFFVTGFEIEGNEFILKSYNSEVRVRSVIFAPGSSPKKLGIEGEEEFFGSGVSYCSTCDGMFFKGRRVFVIGGGNSAFEAVEHLSYICDTVTLVHRRDQFRADSILVERARKMKNVDFILNSVADKIEGSQSVESISVKNVVNNQVIRHKCDGVFVYVGALPKNELFSNILDCNEQGYIKVDCDMKTSIPGIFAAGDIIDKPVRQIVTAAADGCIAGLGALSYLAAL
ncbi:MAG: thioredoxin-disulfide reductase [Oligoflexia bacterium]|nr:thioredoxin-disulfide reductase [Oligoflexia bacterium]